MALRSLFLNLHIIDDKKTRIFFRVILIIDNSDPSPLHKKIKKEEVKEEKMGKNVTYLSNFDYCYYLGGGGIGGLVNGVASSP